MFGKVRIKSYEKGLLFKFGDFVKLLEPGSYRLWSKLWSRKRAKVSIVSTLVSKFEHPLLDVLVRHPDMARALTVVELADHERALVWKDGRLAHVLGTGRHAFWNQPYELKFEVFDANTLRFEHQKMEAIVAHPGSSKWLVGVNVDESSFLRVHAGARTRQVGSSTRSPTPLRRPSPQSVAPRTWSAWVGSRLRRHRRAMRSARAM